MKRLLYNSLKKWKLDKNHKPLILRGARQVGKTHLVRQFATTFENCVEINLESMPESRDIFVKDLNPERILRDLSLLMGKKITPEKTLLFLDEIQEMPQAITALRYFYEMIPSLHVIAAGSLIDFAIEQIGVPVGRVSFLYMHPMSFIEFLVAVGETLLVSEILKHKPETPLLEPIHNKLLDLLGEYFAVGGMPEVVNRWLQSHDIQECNLLQRSLLNAYRQDFQKHAKKHQLMYLDLIFSNIPRLLGHTVKFTQFSKEHRKRELSPCLELLIKANVTHKVIQSSGQGVPLAAESDPEKFKLIFLDIALAQAMLGLDQKNWLLKPELEFLNKGEIVEAFIGQELLVYSHPSKSPELYYWQREERSSQAEVDYLVSSDHRVIPVEVKSGGFKNLKSLKYFLQTHLHSEKGICFSPQNYFLENQINYFPLYAIAGVFAENHEGILDLIND